jgi:hypothetical protein
MRAPPLAQSRKQGPIFFCLFASHLNTTLFDN